ncbi:MAG: hypothetical protein JNL47_09275, partial [Bacteroidia bacterium]|nr:hypothetical protein [Bacteroidia bacterium]
MKTYRYYLGGITPSTFRGNTMYDHYAGLYLNKVAVIDTQTHAGNRWLGTYSSSYGAVNMNDSTFINLAASLITTNQTVASHNPKIPLNNSLPPFYVNDQGWFDPQTLGSSFSCSGSTYCNAAIVVGGDDETMLRIAQDDEITTEFISESKLMAKQQLFDELKKDSALLQTDTAYQVFVINNLNTSIGILQEVAEKYSELKKVSSVLGENLHYTDSIVQQYADSLQMLDSIHATEPLPDYESRRVNLVEQLNAYQHQLQQYCEEQKQNDASTLVAISQLNNSVTASEQPDENEKFINEMTAHYYNDNKTALTTNRNLIEMKAQLCPYIGGASVFRARAIIRIFNDSAEYDDATACSLHGIYRATAEQNNKGS